MADRCCEMCRWWGPPREWSDPHKGNCDFPIPPAPAWVDLEGCETEPDFGDDCAVFQPRMHLTDPELAELLRARGGVERLTKERDELYVKLGWSVPVEQTEGAGDG